MSDVQVRADLPMPTISHKGRVSKYGLDTLDVGACIIVPIPEDRVAAAFKRNLSQIKGGAAKRTGYSFAMRHLHPDAAKGITKESVGIWRTA